MHLCVHVNQEQEPYSSKLEHMPMWIKAERSRGKRETYLKKWVVKMVGEVIELGSRDGCGQKGGWSTGRREMQIAVVSSSGVWRETEGGVCYSRRGDEIVSSGCLIDMMKSESRNVGSMQDPSGIWVRSDSL